MAAAAAATASAASGDPAAAATPGGADPAAAVDDEHDCKDTVVLRHFLKEWELIKSLLAPILASPTTPPSPSSIRQIRSTLDKYQEQGHLLEPYLSTIVPPLMHIIRSTPATPVLNPLCIIIHTLTTVCGYKPVIRFFPHQVSDLELAMALLERCHDAPATTSLRQESTGEMEAKCVVLLWLYILVLIPFDIDSVDSKMAEERYRGGPSPLVMRMVEVSKGYLGSAGPMRKMAGLLLARLLTRPDMGKAFNSFTEWSHEVLLSVTDDIVEHFRLLGVVEALASIFKVGSRQTMLNVVSLTWIDSSLLMKSTTATRSPLLRKLIVKLSQRIGLTCLPHRLPIWRYQGKKNSLGETILLKPTERGEATNLLQVGDQFNNKSNPSCLEEDMDVPEIVEEIIELLLSGLRDSDTVVRWSAAKGIGRITARLTSALSEDVLSSILELFSPGEGDGSWHGGCLALAELARRGLLLPVSFPKVVPLIIKALHYDIRRGPHSIGSHVRDAAAYVCWAFGRAYSDSDMKDILEQLAPHLLTVACYDREVNCRRAASAAFQENVGRQGSFPHGIDIVSTADYFSLASRASSYLHVAVSIAEYKDYLYPFAEELLGYKMPHWDKSLRELAAEALAALAKYDPGYFGGYVLDKLVPCTLSLDLYMRHGATLAAGEVILALHQHGFVFPIEKQKSLSDIVPAIEKARLYRGKGGEIMRSAVSRFIECISLSKISLTERTKRSLLDTLNENLKHPNAQIQRAAIDALKHFVRAYIVASNEKISNGIISKYLELLDDANVAARRGAALALGILPSEFFAVNWKVVVTKLCLCCTIQHKPDDPDAEARVNAIHGLVSVCETLAGSSDNDFEEITSLYLLIKIEVMQSLFQALDDYSIDNRGDVGSWVREAAMYGLERCTYILCERDTLASQKEPGVKQVPEDTIKSDPSYPLFDTKIATSLVGGIAKQAVEKIDKIREIAVKTLQRILYNQKCFVPFIPHRELLEDIIPNDTNLKWAVPAVSYPRLVQLLQLTCYSKFILSGLVISVGGLQDSLRKTSVTALVEYIQVAKADRDGKINTVENLISTDLLWTLQRYKKCDRVIIPTLKTIEILLSRKFFLNMEGTTLEFGVGIMNSLAVELKGSRDFAKLCTGISILGYIASLIEPISSRALSQLLAFLGHRYPKMRKAAADQVYLVLLQNVNLVAEDKMDRALEVLSESCWEGALDEAKLGRAQLYELSGLETDTPLQVTKRASTKGTATTQTDENVSYSSLVDFRGF